MECNGPDGVSSIIDITPILPMIIITIIIVVIGLIIVVIIDKKKNLGFFMFCETNYGFFEKIFLTIMYIWFMDIFGLKFAQT